MPTALVILGDGFEEIEAITPIDLLRRAGVEVTTASAAPSIHVTGRSGITLHTDTVLDPIPGLADVLVLPGGPGVKALRADPRVAGIVRAHAAAARPIAAICAAPLLLADAGLLDGRRFTSHASTAGDLPTRLAEERVVVDGPILTSRGAGTSLEFGLALVALLCGEAKRAEIAASIGA
jgi:protein deglycase